MKRCGHLIVVEAVRLPAFSALTLKIKSARLYSSATCEWP